MPTLPCACTATAAQLRRPCNTPQSSEGSTGRGCKDRYSVKASPRVVDARCGIQTTFLRVSAPPSISHPHDCPAALTGASFLCPGAQPQAHRPSVPPPTPTTFGAFPLFHTTVATRAYFHSTRWLSSTAVRRRVAASCANQRYGLG